MKLMVLLIFWGCAVKCEESNNYYVVQRPSEEPIRGLKPFQVYWNVPTMQCRSKKVFFESLFQRYGIVQNKGDSFRGEEIVILYDPGLFPAILKGSSGKMKLRNGGVPQEGNLDEHLTAFMFALNSSIPDPEFSGIGVIDFESWRPVFRQNFGELAVYKNVSLLNEKRLHPWWPKSWIEAEARSRFELAGRKFMQATLFQARMLRPRARWGYYAFPYCFNMAGSHLVERCADNVPKENDQISWLWSDSTALFPSVYSSKNLSSSQLAALIRQRVAETARVGTGSPILPYFWFRYRDGGFMSEVDLKQALKTMYKSNASGFIIWGSSNDVNTVTKCEKLSHYLENVLGPAIAKYTKQTYKNEEIDLEQNDMNVSTESPYDNKPNETKYDENELEEHIYSDNDPEYDTNNNYTEDISERLVEEYFDGNKTEAETDTYNDRPKDPNNSILIDILLSVIENVHKSNNKELMEKEMVKINRDRKKGTPIHNTFGNPNYENNYDPSTTSPLTNSKKKGAFFSFLFTTPQTPKFDNVVATQVFTSTEVSTTELNKVSTTYLNTIYTTEFNKVSTAKPDTTSTTEICNDNTTSFNADTFLDYNTDYTANDEPLTETFEAEIEEVFLANKESYTTEVTTTLNESSTITESGNSSTTLHESSTTTESGNSMTESEITSSTTDGTTAVNMGVLNDSLYVASASKLVVSDV